MLIKLTDEHGSSREGTLWAIGCTVEIPERDRGLRLCSAGLLHVYEADSVHLPLMLNPRHAHIKGPVRAFEVSGHIVAREGQLKAGGHCFRVIRELPVPEITTEQRVLFAIMCAFETQGTCVSVASAAYAAYAASAADARAGLFSHLAQEACTD